jgi:hypothetical protein
MMALQRKPSYPADDPQAIKLRVDLLPGPLTEAVAQRMLHIVVSELIELGAEVTAVRVEIKGWMASW